MRVIVTLDPVIKSVVRDNCVELESRQQVCECVAFEVITGKRKLIFEQGPEGILIVGQVMVDDHGKNIGEPIGIGIV